MRRYGIEKPYEKLKKGRIDPWQKRVDAEGMKRFIDSLALRKQKNALKVAA